MSEDVNVSDDDIAKFCSNCGNSLAPDANFCKKCGKQVKKQVSQVDNKPSGSPPLNSPPIGPPIYPTSPDGLSSSSFGSGPVNPQGRVPPNYTQPQPQQQPIQNSQYQYDRQIEDQGPRGVVSNNIRPVSGQFMDRTELKIAAIFGLTGFFSHFIRYLILFNSFPDIITLLLPIPFYVVLGIIILGFNKYLMRNKGVDIEFEADNYDYMVSSVFSSFFLSLMNYRFKFKAETSTIPDIVYHPQNTKQGMQYLELPKAQYIGLFVRPQAFFSLIMMTTLFGIFTLIYYFQDPFSNLGLIARFMAMYLGGMGVSHLSPRVGRVNEEMANVGRFRTLFIFLISFFVFLIALIGNRFFIVLQ